MEALLIEQVKIHEALYNTKCPGYRDHQIRQESWEKISRQLNMKAETAKFAWDKLRRCFLNAINRRRRVSGQPAKKIPPWKYEHQMTFLLPFIDSRKPQGIIKDEYSQDERDCQVDYTQEPEININEHTDTPPKQSSTTFLQEILRDKKEDVPYFLNNIKINKERDSNSIIKKVRTAKKMRTRERSRYDNLNQEMDETDMFFLSMSKMTKTLSPLEQAQIKLQLSTSVLQAQIKQQSEPFVIRPPSTNSGSTSPCFSADSPSQNDAAD